MRSTRHLPARVWVIVVGLLLATSAADGAIIWSGLTTSFSKASFTDHTQPQNQDRITDTVWLTRAATQGLFNIHTESSYAATSPAGTRWATDINNAGKTIAAANWADLAFTDWITAYGGTGTTQLPSRLIGRDAVVHLVQEGVYLDLRFTSWDSGSGPGGFAYQRAEGVIPEPASVSAALLLAALVSLRPHRRVMPL